MTKPTRVLFAAPYPGYLRLFDSTLRLLAERGHEIEVWFETLHKQPEGLEAIEAVDGITLGGQLPKRRDRYEHAARASRIALDYVRYLDPRFKEADYLRARPSKLLRGWRRGLRKLPMLPPRAVRTLIRSGLAVERAVPRSPEFDALIAERQPGLVIVTPVVMFASRLADLVESAQAAGIPTVGAVGSWDNLTTKGIFRVVPDRVLVWNEPMVDEAVELHLLPRERVVATGAPSFDKWFDRQPRRDADAFRERVGLPKGKPYVLFAGSTASISDPDAEIRFVVEWLRRLREHGAFRDVAVMIRPHPFNFAHWPEVDLSPYAPTVLWPPNGANPVNEDDRADYFDSIHHSAAVVGINTSAMIESAIQRKPVFSVVLPEFQETQTGTLHFHHLLPENGGFLRTASSYEQHFAQLEDALANPEQTRAQVESFLARFVRPQGLDRPATPIVADVLEEVVDNGPLPPPREGPLAHALGWLAIRTIFFGPGRRRALRYKVSRAARAS